MKPAARPSSRSASPFRGLRRWTVDFVALVVGLLAMRYGWNALADRRIAELERQAHAMGQPLLLSDFKPEAISDADNAAVPIGQALVMFAASRVAAGNPAFPRFTIDEDQPISSADLPALASFVSSFQAERNLIRQARNRPRIVWSIHPVSPVYQQRLPQIWEAREMAEVLSLSADYARTQGDESETVEDISDLLLLQKAADRYFPVPIVHLASMSIAEQATSSVRRAAMDLRIADDSKAGATRQQVKALIADLLDEQSFRAEGIRAFYGEAAMVIDAAPYEAHRLPSIGGWLFEPLYKADAANIADVRTADARILQQPTWPGAKAALKPEPAKDMSLIEYFAHPMFHAYIFDPQRWTQLHFQHVAERRIAAVMLALRLYQHDHGDALPHTLGELVPEYLPSLLADPFDPAGKPLRYLPLHESPILYSVGENGTDEGGSEKPIRGRKLTANGLSVNRWLERDAVFSLKPIPRLLQAQDQQGDVESSKGQQDEK